jgi:NAD(P)H-binding
VKAALEAGHSVRALARSARRISVDDPKLEKMAGDALEMSRDGAGSRQAVDLRDRLWGGRQPRPWVFFNLALHMPMGRIYDDKDVQERIVRSSKLDWVIMRPLILTDGPKTNTYRALIDPRDWTYGFISRADVADFFVKQIDHEARDKAAARGGYGVRVSS